MKKRPKIKKYATGGSAADPYRREDGTMDYNAKYNPDAGQYAATGTATIVGGANIGRVYSQPNATMADKYNTNSGAATGIVSSISPLYGGLTAATYQVAKPIKKGLEASNEDGSLKNPGLAKAGVVANSFITDPLSSISTNVSNGVWTPDQYTDRLEEENKQRIEQEQMQTYSQGGRKMPKINCYPDGGKYKTHDKMDLTNDQVIEFAQRGWYPNLIPDIDKKRILSINKNAGVSNNGYNIDGKPLNAMSGVQSASVGRLMDNWYQPQDMSKINKVNNKGNALWLDDKDNYAMGGTNGVPNAELEKEEVFQMPNGQIDNVDGASHSKGGVDVNIPTGTQILSDRLKMPGTKKTFAALAKPYTTTKEDKLLTDGDNLSPTKKTSLELSKMVKNTKLNELFNVQESLKEQKVKNYAKKLGIDGNKFAFGGTKPPYENELETPMGWDDGVSPYSPEYLNTNEQAFYPTPTGEQIPNNYVEVPKRYTTPNRPKIQADPNRTKFDYTQLGDATSGLVQNIGPAFDLYQTKFGKAYDKENSGQLTPKLPDFSQSFKNLKEGYYAGKKDINAISGGNAALSIANLRRNRTGYNRDFANLNEQAENSKVGIENQFALHNQGTRMLDRSNEQQNKASSEDITRQAISSIGTNSANAYRDYKGTKQQNESLAMIAQMYPNYEYKNGVWKHRTRGTILTDDINKGNTK